MLFGRDIEADANSRSNGRSMFDGDLLVHGDVLVCLLTCPPHSAELGADSCRKPRWTSPSSHWE
jgi:actin-related protein 5